MSDAPELNISRDIKRYHKNDSRSITAQVRKEKETELEQYQSFHDKTVSWEDEVILCVEMVQCKMGICVLDMQQETLQVLNQDIIITINTDTTENQEGIQGHYTDEVNLILECLIKENEPSIVIVSSRIEEATYAHMKELAADGEFELQMQTQEKFKSQFFVQVWRRFQDVCNIIEIEGFKLLDQLVSNSSNQITSMAVSCLIRMTEKYQPTENELLGALHFFEIISKVSQLLLKDRMFLDEDTISALQIFNSIKITGHDKMIKNGCFSIFQLLDHTTTDLSRRTLKAWLVSPLFNKTLIDRRFAVIRILLREQNSILFDDLCSSLNNLPNIFKIMNEMGKSIAKVRTWKRLFLFIEKSLEIVRLTEVMDESEEGCYLFSRIKNEIDKNGLVQVSQKMNKIIDLEASISQDSVIIRDWVSSELDDSRKVYDELDQILNIEAKEALQQILLTQNTNETPLLRKLKYNNSLINAIYVPQLGYLLSIDLTLESILDVNRLEWTEVFRTEDAIYYKTEDTRAMDEHYGDIYAVISDLEIELLYQLQTSISDSRSVLFKCGKYFAELEVLVSFAKVSRARNYVQPKIIDNENVLEIRNGRHPLYETLVRTYIPNNLFLNGGSFNDDEWKFSHERITVITGANASGKSVFLTQNGLIVFLAHIGCFVPADDANIGLVDKILTRILSRETILKTQSTFELDAIQMSKCLLLTTSRSLILIDEFGKGTDVVDGPAIFGSIIKKFSDSKQCPRILACTHYQELFGPCILTSSIPGVFFQKTEILLQSNTSDSSQNMDNQNITFLYKLSDGISEGSFGVYCAKICGLNENIVSRAESLAHILSQGGDIVEQCTDLTSSELDVFEKNQKIAKRFLAWDLDLESDAKNYDLVLLRKLERTLDLK